MDEVIIYIFTNSSNPTLTQKNSSAFSPAKAAPCFDGNCAYRKRMRIASDQSLTKTCRTEPLQVY